MQAQHDFNTDILPLYTGCTKYLSARMPRLLWTRLPKVFKGDLMMEGLALLFIAATFGMHQLLDYVSCEKEGVIKIRHVVIN